MGVDLSSYRSDGSGARGQSDSGQSGFVRAVNPGALDGGPGEFEFVVNWMKSLIVLAALVEVLPVRPL